MRQVVERYRYDVYECVERSIDHSRVICVDLSVYPDDRQMCKLDKEVAHVSRETSHACCARPCRTHRLYLLCQWYFGVL